MPQDKDRLYIALYAREGAPSMPGKEDTYHWSFVITPKVETEGGSGWLYHAKEIPKAGEGIQWYFQERECSLYPSAMILVRIMIAKVEDHDSVREVLRSVPIRQDQRGWNYVHWIKEALANLDANKRALGTRVVDWPKVRNAGMAYCQKKRDARRFDGTGQYDTNKIPTLDLIEGKETIP